MDRLQQEEQLFAARERILKARSNASWTKLSRRGSRNVLPLHTPDCSLLFYGLYFWQAFAHHGTRSPFNDFCLPSLCRNSGKRCGTKPTKPTTDQGWKIDQTAASAAVSETSARYV